MTREVFTLPDLGEGLEEAQLVRWLVRVGDQVAVDAPVAEVETAKAMVEVPCPYAGQVACLHGDEGDVIAVGSPLVSVDAGTPAPAPADASRAGRSGGPADDAAQHPAAAAYVQEERAGSGNVLIGYGTSDTPTAGGGRRAARRAARAAIPPAAAAAPAAAPPSGGTRTAVAVSSPLVRTLARRAGVDLTALHGSGPGGLVMRRDVERAAAGEVGVSGAAEHDDAAAAPRPGAGRAAAHDAASAGTDERTGLAVRALVPLTGVRRTIAATLSRSRQEIPEATTWVDVDATGLLELRSQLGTPDRPAPGILALVARFVVAGLERFPELNARVDTDGGQIVHLAGVNLGIAAQTERGLVVPVVRGAHTLRTRALHEEIQRLTTAAREGRATTADLTGGSFTLNNYGVLGVDGSAAIINHPEVAILGMGRIMPRPWVVDGDVVVRSITQLSLVFDHRVCDGGTAGGFLRFVADAIERPLPHLLDLAEL
ncbi:dihydrolipoamide acetyltransferase family protein [Actinotalea sp. Marseille-Q4924]|uniref:dihydrolipoamide acetyltransferase family protein n=1 Tax=Actinotalea sp. Marseille-Q4924 TaxID=2866571 RepID=UPI001CE41D08|nr:dihydrolipoamide acetyltransferase family protein [Actinotalea sp. Marseille-Q4924]